MGKATLGSKLLFRSQVEKEQMNIRLLPSRGGGRLMPQKIPRTMGLRDTSENVCGSIVLLTPNWKGPTCPLAAEGVNKQFCVQRLPHSGENEGTAWVNFRTHAE